MLVGCVEADDLSIETLGNPALDSLECAAADEKNVLRIHMEEFLLRMLAASLRWHIHDTSLKKLEHCLLHAFSRHVSGYRRIVALAGDLVDLVNENDTSFRSCDIVVRLLKQTREDTLHILSHISCLCKDSSVNDCERHIKELGYSLGHQGLTGTGRTYHENI